MKFKVTILVLSLFYICQNSKDVLKKQKIIHNFLKDDLQNGDFTKNDAKRFAVGALLMFSRNCAFKRKGVIAYTI